MHGELARSRRRRATEFSHLTRRNTDHAPTAKLVEIAVPIPSADPAVVCLTNGNVRHRLDDVVVVICLNPGVALAVHPILPEPRLYRGIRKVSGEAVGRNSRSGYPIRAGPEQ